MKVWIWHNLRITSDQRALLFLLFLLSISVLFLPLFTVSSSKIVILRFCCPKYLAIRSNPISELTFQPNTEFSWKHCVPYNGETKVTKLKPSRLRQITVNKEYLLVLCWPQVGLLNQHQGDIIGVSVSTFCKIVATWVCLLAKLLDGS